jgi:hypothetical protein
LREDDYPDVPNQPMFTAQEIADITHRHFRTVYGWRKAGLLRMHKVGRMWMASRSDVIDFLNATASDQPEGVVLPFRSGGQLANHLVALFEAKSTTWDAAVWG